jgi:drug/metabolite transporter (DMT)-like permease
MLAIVLALASAIGYGGSDFAAGLASRGAGILQVTLLATTVSLLPVSAALPFATGGHPPSAAALAWGAGAGLGGTVGALALYFGYRQAAFSVAGPLSAVGAAGFSVLAGLLFGERPTALALTGIVLALPAIVGVSASAAGAGSGGGGGASGDDGADGDNVAGGDDGGGAEAESEARGRRLRPGGGVIAGLIAGAGFALLFIGLDRAGSGSGLWPVAASQGAELVAVLAAAAVTGNVRLPAARAGWLAAITGVAGTTATILYFFATHEGFLAVTAVLTSLYPAVTIVLARTLLGERLTRLRLAGLSLAAVCVALIAAGGAGLLRGADGPGVHGFVGVHVLDVALGHLAQRLRAAGAAVPGDLRHGGYLPGGAGLAGQAALLDDAEQPVGVGRADAQLVEPLAGQRQQAAQDQLRHRHITDPGPVELGVQAVPGGLVQVLRGGGERHLGPDRAL